MGFVDQPIINAPFDPPRRHYELDEHGQPTGTLIDGRRESRQVVPVAAPRRRGAQQAELELFDEAGGSRVTPNALINEIRTHVEPWRALPPGQWGVTPETQRLLLHWRDPDRSRKLFFCQREAVETLIYLTEVAPARFRRQIVEANAEANPGLYRLACKMATGAGKTTVMGMIIAWHAVNRARRPNAKSFSDAFLVVSPGITIRDRLRVLLPGDPENVYERLDLVPTDLMDGVRRARIVITNYHALDKRETFEGGRLTASIILGRDRDPDRKKIRPESDGEMIARVAKELMGRRNIVVLNGHARRRGDRAQRLLRPQLPQGRAMKLHYYPETDSLYIELAPGPGVETREIAPGLNIDVDAAGSVVGLDIDGASRTLDLSTLETVALPLTTTRAA